MDSWSAIGNELLEKCIIEIKKKENNMITIFELIPVIALILLILVIKWVH